MSESQLSRSSLSPYLTARKIQTFISSNFLKQHFSSQLLDFKIDTKKSDDQSRSKPVFHRKIQKTAISQLLEDISTQVIDSIYQNIFFLQDVVFIRPSGIQT